MTSIIVRYGEIHSYLREEARPVRLYLDTSSLHKARLKIRSSLKRFIKFVPNSMSEP